MGEYGDAPLPPFSLREGSAIGVGPCQRIEIKDDLDGDGPYSDEIAGMEGRTVGDEMWRVEVTHFTPWDYNWPYGPPGGAEYPDAKVASVKKCDDECEKSNTMAMNEAIPFPGTPLTLDYDSDRVESLRTVIDVGASGAIMPSGLDNIKSGTRSPVCRGTGVGPNYHADISADSFQKYAFSGLKAVISPGLADFGPVHSRQDGEGHILFPT